MVLFECPGYLRVLYVEGKSYIVFAWEDFSIPLDQLKKAHEIALSFAGKQKCPRYIADCSRARDSLLPEAIVWWRSEWVPRLIASSLNRIITIVPSSTLAALSNRDWQRDLNEGMELVNVESLAEAEAALGDCCL
jgi:hypothetical protein